MKTSPVRFPADARPRVFLVVDTEEEFDWNAPFSRAATQVTAIGHASRLQRVAERYGVRPTWVVDYPIATSPLAVEVLGPTARRGRCTIGAHLHPWVNPPFTEPLTRANSFACNLDPALERQKIALLREAIAESFGVDARVYKAGRYGFGPSTASTLEQLGFDVDLSVNPCMDFRGEGGPSFTAFDAQPFTFGAERTLLEIPCSTGYVGAWRSAGATLHARAASPAGVRLHVPGVLARLGLLNKVMLSPEGFTGAEMMALAKQLYADGVRTFSVTLHSPSLAPGHTAYARTSAEVDALLATVDRFLEFFFTELRGVPATPADLHRELCTRAAA